MSRSAELNANSNSDTTWIDTYLTDNLDAPPKEDYDEFLSAYTDIAASYSQDSFRSLKVLDTYQRLEGPRS